MTKNEHNIPMRPIEIWIPDVPNAIAEIKKSCEIERKAKSHQDDFAIIDATGAWDD